MNHPLTQDVKRMEAVCRLGCGHNKQAAETAGHGVKYHEMHRRFAGSRRFCARTRSGAGATHQFRGIRTSGAVKGLISSVVTSGFAENVEIRHRDMAVVLDADGALLAQLSHLPANGLDGEAEEVSDIGA